jgi:glycolate oxidase FAD binding subunit
MDYALSQLCEQVTTARAHLKSIEIVGGHTKRFYGNPASSEAQTVKVDTTALSGIVSYEPSELVITALAGTPLSEIERCLDESGQMLAFDPPSFGSASTIGGVVAAGLSGPQSFGYGPLRQYVLGAHLLDAQGRILKFGGEVMKNVAGYDVSRLLSGSMGMFGIIVQVSLKVIPKPMHQATQMFSMSLQQALVLCESLRSKPMPIKAAAWLPGETSAQDGTLAIRLAGAQSAVKLAQTSLGGEAMQEQEATLWWQAFRDHQASHFHSGNLWRVAVRACTPDLGFGPTAFDLAGELRWIITDAPVTDIRQLAREAGGHASFFRGDQALMSPDGVFDPLPVANREIVKRLKQEFDPKAIFNPGRLVAGI